MRFLSWMPALALVVTATSGHTDPITLPQAVARAAARPTVAMADADLAAARGLAAGARRPIYNPEVGAAVGPRRVGGSTGIAVDLSIAQTLELGGKRAARVAVAAARVTAAGAGRVVAARQAELEARRAFELALVARARIDAARAAEELAVQMEIATRHRQELGAGTQLQTNLAAAEVGRAHHDRVDAESQYEAELAALATAVGAGPDERLEPAGELGGFVPSAWTEDELVTRALAQRPELAQAQAERAAAVAEVRLADAVGRPDVTVGLSYGFEQDVDVDAHTVMVSASIGLPFRNRNQGERSATRARVGRAELDLQRQRAEVVRAARLAARTYVRARDALAGFDAQINQRLGENLALARQSFDSGKIDYFEFNVVRRELIANRTAHLDAIAEAVDAWHALARAAGEEQTP